MTWYDLLLLLEKLIPPVLVLITAWLLIRSFLRSDANRREVEAETSHKDKLLQMKLESRKELMPIRLQAYERLLLFLERNRISNLFLRLRKNSMSAQELQVAMANAVREEFDHNLSQQLYVSREAWLLLCEVKDRSINLIITHSPDSGESSLDYGSRLVELSTQGLVSNCDKAVETLVSEVSRNWF